MSRLLLNKQNNLVLIILFIFFIFSIYVFTEYKSIKNQSSNYLTSGLVLKYDIYLSLFEKNMELGSFEIENRDYINTHEFIEEYKKSTPLYTQSIEKEISKFELTFEYFKKNDENIKIQNYIQQLEEKDSEYLVDFLENDKVLLLGKIHDKAYVLINQNIKEYKQNLKKVDYFFVLIIFFFFILIVFFIYLLLLKKSVKEMSNDLKKSYEELSSETKKVAFEDSLTKAASRLKFDETLKDLIQVASRFDQQNFSVIIMDIDNFKSINDTYGHYYGDIVLKSIATKIKTNLRTSDTFARWGGEEFVILSPFLDIKQAYQLAEKLRIIINQIKFEKLDFVTCSFGVVEYKKTDTEDRIIKRADELLYKAKENGKNRVEYK